MKARTQVAAAAVVTAVIIGTTHAHHHHHDDHTRTVDTIQLTGNVDLGRQLAARDYDWRGGQWQCLDTLWEGESGWSQYADTRRTYLDAPNATVFAYGIPQARPATKMPRSAQPADLGGSSNRRTQILWGLRYIDERYGSPCAALAFKRANNNEGY